MKVFALTFGDENCPSTNYRLIQFKKLLLNDGIELDHEIAKPFKDFKKLAGYDIVILQKNILSASKIRQIAKHAKRLIYDVDDRIWLRPSKKHSFFTQIRINHRMLTICRCAETCMVANEVIAKDIISYGGKPSVVPMALDGKIWFPKEKENDKVVLGWTGAPANLPFLEKILNPLRNVLNSNPNTRLVIHCGQDPCFENLEYEYIRFIPGKEQDVVRSFDIGLLPLPQNDPFADGKSPIKGIQYIASGVVVVATKTFSAVNLLGNQNDGGEFVRYAETIDDWAKILSQLIRNRNELTHIGKKVRDFFESNYEFSTTYNLLRSVLQNHYMQ